jgi:ubiquinone/menaquinone biosynthesis C-methylase UbiE
LERYCLASWRSDLLSLLDGDVLELGAGTGVNLDYYQQGNLSSLTLVEPDPFMRRRLARKLGQTSIAKRTKILDSGAEVLPLGDASVDAVVATLVLCSVRDVARVLGEARRVLRPGGKLALIEHIAAPMGTRRRRWQNCLEPTWTFLSGGCHLLRDPRPAIETNGFRPHQVLERELSCVPGFLKSAIAGLWKAS